MSLSLTIIAFKRKFSRRVIRRIIIWVVTYISFASTGFSKSIKFPISIFIRLRVKCIATINKGNGEMWQLIFETDSRLYLSKIEKAILNQRLRKQNFEKRNGNLPKKKPLVLTKIYYNSLNLDLNVNFTRIGKHVNMGYSIFIFLKIENCSFNSQRCVQNFK